MIERKIRYRPKINSMHVVSPFADPVVCFHKKSIFGGHPDYESLKQASSSDSSLRQEGVKKGGSPGKRLCQSFQDQGELSRLTYFISIISLRYLRHYESMRSDHCTMSTWDHEHNEVSLSTHHLQKSPISSSSVHWEDKCSKDVGKSIFRKGE